MLKEKAISDHYTLLGFGNKTIKNMIERDKKCRLLWKKGKEKIPKCNQRRHRIELIKLSTTIYEVFVVNLINRIKIIIDLKTKAIKDYWLNSFEPIMKELDKLLWKQEEKCVKNCRNTAFGFCFCKDTKGNYLNN